ncbi:hypothetical protein [Corallococcus sp. CA049B]|uniref:hypothetical protein n=1 Tax=Corallococcus sp. CA049B TaxID=2316730 RepID=UPI0011C36D31|nr:hypothetical protein [Corallococcus sp. CA049B]
MRLNVLMQAYLRNAQVQAVQSRPLTPRMQALLAEGVVGRHGLWVWRRKALESAPAVHPTFPDATGYECFANKVHVSDFVGNLDEEPWERRLPLKEQVGYGLRLALELQRVLPAEKLFTTILGCSNACTLRFHLTRPGERWLGENLENYPRNALLELGNQDDVRGWAAHPP